MPQQLPADGYRSKLTISPDDDHESIVLELMKRRLEHNEATQPIDANTMPSARASPLFRTSSAASDHLDYW